MVTGVPRPQEQKDVQGAVLALVARQLDTILSGLPLQRPGITSRRDQPKYRGTSLIRNRLLLGPYSSPVPGGLGWS